MADKAAFTPEEWTTIMESVMLSGMAVTAADPSGLIGLLKESMATSRNLLAAKSSLDSTELVRAVAADFATSEGRQAAREGLKATLQGTPARDVAAKSIARLRDVVSLVERKAPGDAAGFKTWLQHIAVDAAEAASEGGFLGFGGVQVSDAERATLKELSSALGLAETEEPATRTASARGNGSTPSSAKS